MWADRSLFHKVPLIIFLKINLSVIHCMLLDKEFQSLATCEKERFNAKAFNVGNITCKAA